MPKEYCMKCGTGTDYSITKPSACKKCNNSYVDFKSIAVVGRQLGKTETQNAFIKQGYEQSAETKPFIIHDNSGNSINLNAVDPKRLLRELNIEPIGEDEIIFHDTTTVNLAKLAPEDATDRPRPARRGRPPGKARAHKEAANLAQEFFSEGDGEIKRNDS